jgi:anaphase-promoting complex subunit 3
VGLFVEKVLLGLTLKFLVFFSLSLDITTLLKKFADGCYYLNSYNCLEAIEEFKKLPQQHFNTGWVLSNVGKAYMEIVRYQDAANFYEQAFRNEPHRT